MDKETSVESFIYCEKCGYHWVEKATENQPKPISKPCKKCGELVHLD